jgi:hypothetical protein
MSRFQLCAVTTLLLCGMSLLRSDRAGSAVTATEGAGLIGACAQYATVGSTQVCSQTCGYQTITTLVNGGTSIPQANPCGTVTSCTGQTSLTCTCGT